MTSIHYSVGLFALFTLINIHSANACISKLRNPTFDERAPQCNPSGQATWSGWDSATNDWEIYRWNAGAVERLTTVAAEDRNPTISATGAVVWMRWDGNDWDIVRKDSLTDAEVLVTDNPSDNNADDLFPRMAVVSGTPRVIWLRPTATPDRYDLYSKDGAGAEVLLSTNVVIDPESEEYDPKINDSGQVAYVWWDGSDTEIKHWNAGVTTQLSNNSGPDYGIQMNAAAGKVVWHGWNSGAQPANWDIYQWNGSTTTAISTSNQDDVFASLNGSGTIVWMGDTALGWEIFRWNGSAVEQLTVNAASDTSPTLNSVGQVCWLQTNGSTQGTLCIRTGTTDQEIARNGALTAQVQIDSSGNAVWLGFDGTYWSVYRYQPNVITTLSVAPATLSRGADDGGGSDEGQGTVILAAPAPTGGAEVTLTSSNPAAAEVPEKLVIAAGATTATFRVKPLGGVTAGTVAISATYNGCTLTDTVLVAPLRGIAVFRPSTQQWLIRDIHGQTTTISPPWTSQATDQPVPGDYEGTGRTQAAVFRPATAEWFVRRDDGTWYVVQHGGVGDQPVPGDYEGRGYAQFAVFRPSTGVWYVKRKDGTQYSVQWGGASQKPAPADYAGVGRAQIAYYDPPNVDGSSWLIRFDDSRFLKIPFGAPDDQPIPGDYRGWGGVEQIAVFRPGTAHWLLRANSGGSTTLQFGTSGDQPVPFDFFGVGHRQIAVFRPIAGPPSVGQWLIRSDEGPGFLIPFGEASDKPVPGNYSAN